MAARKRVKMNIPMVAACVLLCLTLFSIHFTGDIYARYTAKGSGMDSSRAAKFEITEKVTRGEESLASELVLDFVPGETDIKVSVENKSEVAVDYTITIENKTQNIPLVFKIGDKDTGINPATFSMEANTEQAFDVFVIWSAEGADEYMGMVDLIIITLEAVQKD